jgi:hypothetical protein
LWFYFISALPFFLFHPLMPQIVFFLIWFNRVLFCSWFNRLSPVNSTWHRFVFCFFNWVWMSFVRIYVKLVIFFMILIYWYKKLKKLFKYIFKQKNNFKKHLMLQYQSHTLLAFLIFLWFYFYPLLLFYYFY